MSNQDETAPAPRPDSAPEPVPEEAPGPVADHSAPHPAGASAGPPVEEGGNIHVVERDGRRIILVGTAHISRNSVEEVRDVIQRAAPDTVCVELDPARHRALTEEDAWREMDIFQVIRRGQATMLLAHLVLSAFQRRLGEQLGVKPGAEMLQAVQSAEAAGAGLVLADRDVRITLRRTWANLGWWDKFRLMMHLMTTLVLTPSISDEEIEELKNQDMLSQVMESFARAFPRGKSTLIDERDAYLTEKIRGAEGHTIVVVVGAGHMPGILARLREANAQPADLAALETTPGKSLITRGLQWGIPLAILALIAYGFATGGAELGLRLVITWVAFNGVLSALGALAALGHPLTILTAFLAAPLTSLNPLVAAGWVAGLVEAYLRRPMVRDFEALPTDILTLTGFWRNAITRILLVVALSNLGSSAGTLLAAFVMGSQSG